MIHMILLVHFISSKLNRISSLLCRVLSMPLRIVIFNQIFSILNTNLHTIQIYQERFPWNFMNIYGSVIILIFYSKYKDVCRLVTKSYQRYTLLSPFPFICDSPYRYWNIKTNPLIFRFKEPYILELHILYCTCVANKQ